MRFLPITVLLPILFILVGASGCKEGCDDVVCAPAPPLLTVVVRDTITKIVAVRALDTLTGDSIDLPDTVVVVEPTVDVLLTLHTFNSETAGSVVDTIRTTSSDTIFLYDERSRLSSGEFALVAVRGLRADTLERLSLKSVEGCCGYDVIGNYSMRLPEK